MVKAQMAVVVESSSFQLDEFKVKAESLVAKLERVKKDHDARWGTKRIEMLVDANLRVKLNQQLERVFSAQQDRDIERMEKAVQGMIKGYGVLDAWAEDNNIEVKPEINSVEWVMQDKSVMVVVQTHNDAIYYQQFRPELSNRHIWSMEELELLLESDVIKDIMKAKALMPGTRMTRIAPGGITGFDDLPDCGADDGSVCGAHSNQAIHGKGRGIKAGDQYCASLCHACHLALDQGRSMTRTERTQMWDDAHAKSKAALIEQGAWLDAAY